MEVHIADKIIEKFCNHLPCEIRFAMKPQDDTSPQYDEQTGILFGCQYTRGRFEFGIYFKDPLEITKDGIVQIIEKNKRQYKIFAGSAFSMTCYYHWDKNGNIKSSVAYNRSFYDATEVKRIDQDKEEWIKMKKIFTTEIRTLKLGKQIDSFLNGSMDYLLPTLFGKDLLSSQCNSRYFSAMNGRKSLYGRGKDDQVIKNTIRKKRDYVVMSELNGCPGCQRDVVNEWTLNPSVQCCGILVCQTCADMRAKEWYSKQKKSCFGSWLNHTYCNKYK